MFDPPDGQGWRGVMTNPTAPLEPYNPEKRRDVFGIFDDSLALLNTSRRELRRLLDLLEEEEDRPPGKSISDRCIQLERALTTVIQTEAKFYEWHAKHARALRGEDPHEEPDFEAVRFEIGCRIARIRDCCAEPGFPEEPEQG